MKEIEVFSHRVDQLLAKDGRDYAWLEEKTGVSEVQYLTMRYLGCRLSFLLVLTTAIALGVTVNSLVREDRPVYHVSYPFLPKAAKDAAQVLLERFWTSVREIAARNKISDYSLANASGKTIAGLHLCCGEGRDIDIQRAEAIALCLGIPIDSLIRLRLDACRYTGTAKEVAAENGSI